MKTRFFVVDKKLGYFDTHYELKLNPIDRVLTEEFNPFMPKLKVRTSYEYVSNLVCYAIVPRTLYNYELGDIIKYEDISNYLAVDKINLSDNQNF